MKKNIIKIKLVFIFFLFNNITFSQILEGIVKDSINNPLPNSSIIAKPLSVKEKVKFTIADYKGRYRLELATNTQYNIQISSMGYYTINFEYNTNDVIKTKDFVLKESIEKLKEVVINYKYEPIVIKKDTTTYKVNAFTNGNERKLKEQLEKLPGVEVGKSGEVTYQGKKVNRLMVENKSFFGGGTKLGVENIPADAVDQIDFIENYNDVGFMKDVNNSEELVMNVKLKEDKKDFVFGDLVGTLGLKNYYLLNASLFYYSPKLNMSYIGNLNNIGERVFSYEDLTRFQGGVSMYLNSNKKLSNLNDFAQNKTDYISNRSNFNAINFNYEYSKKLDISGFALFSKTLRKNLMVTDINYLQVQSQEKRTSTGKEDNELATLNLKLNFNPEKNTNWFYNINTEFGNQNNNSSIETNSTFNSNLFLQNQFSENISLKHFLERHQKHNRKNTTTFVINHIYNNKIQEINWFTNQPFLLGILPIIPENSIVLDQNKKNKTNYLEMLFKHYYIFNANNHLYSYICFNHKFQNFTTSEKQILNNGNINEFSLNGFGNDIRYNLDDYYIALEYKYNLEKFTLSPSIFIHNYSFNINQKNSLQDIKTVFYEPKFQLKYDFNSGENISFNYKLSNDFPNAELMIENFTLQSYNSVFKGNALLLNERYHQNSLFYTKANLFNNFMLYSVISYNIKDRSIRNNLIIEGVNQFSTPILTSNLEENWFFTTGLTKKINQYIFKLSTLLNGFESFQEINNKLSINIRNSQSVGVNIRTLYKKWPSISIGYNHAFNQLKGIQTSSFEVQRFDFNFDYEFFKNFNLKTDYQWNRNFFENKKEIFQILNTSLIYQKEKSRFSFEIKVNNLMNTDLRFNSTFSTFQTTNQSIFVLPRIILFTLNYKI